MNKYLPIISFLLFSTALFSQGHIVFNGGYMVIDNGAYVVVDNPDGTAIPTPSAGGFISESENDRVKWNIGNTAGTYQLPFRRADGANVGVDATLANAAGGGHFLFSTYATAENNTPYPSDVNNMSAADGSGDNSLYAIDRFYIVDPQGYTTRPDATLRFFYQADEAAGGNMLDIANMGAQRFNPDFGTGSWQGSHSGSSFIWGTSNGGSPSGVVDNVSIDGNDLYRSWTLADYASPLPVELLYFKGECVNDKIHFSWATASEANNDYFTIEAGTDGTNFSPVAQIQGNGNALSTSTYEHTIEAPGRFMYYRLTQTDFDNTVNKHDIIAVQPCSGGQFDVLVRGNSSETPTLAISSSQTDFMHLQLFDMQGRLVTSDAFTVNQGTTLYEFNQRLAFGIYNVRLSSEKRVHMEKIVVGR